MSLNRRINIKKGYLNIIYKVSKILSRNSNFTNALKEILKVLYSYWNVPVSFVALYDPETSQLKISQSFGLTKQEYSKGIFKKGEGIIGSIFRNDIPAVLYDLKDNPKYLNKIKLIEKFQNSVIFIGVPIKVGGEKFGVLSVYKEKTRDFSHENAIQMLSTIGTLIGLTKKMYDRMAEERQYWQDEREILFGKIDNANDEANTLIGISKQISDIRKIVRRAALVDSTVLLTGESGTGKTLIAKIIHNLSSRRDKPFVTINCAAIPENLLEAELFGYEKGAFTSAVSKKKGKFELADKGTLFLDEIGDMSLTLQAKLLNVIQDREISRLGSEEIIPIDIRIIAATNQELRKLIEQGKFREDLYYRLNIIPIFIQPLRNRRDDIMVLIDFFAKKLFKRYKKRIEFSNDAMKYLINYDWPGNIREVENTVERMIAMNDGVIKSEDLPSYITKKTQTEQKISKNVYKDVPSAIKDIEKAQIEKALNQTGYVKSKAARLLGFTIRQLDYRIVKYSISIRRS